MEIIVKSHRIDLKEVTDIYDVERDKKAFLNREAGFIIKLNDKEIKISEGIPYESYPREISEVKKKYKDLQDKVQKEWETVRGEIKIFNL
jgi:hypothetical protein